MSYFDGPNRIMSVMNVPVDDSKCGTLDSISLTNCWKPGSSSCSTVIPFDLPKYSIAISSTACSPEFERFGSVCPSLTKPQAAWPPIAGHPFGDTTALWIVFHDSWPPESTSTFARSSHTTKTSGDSSVGSAVANSLLPVLVCQ